MTTTHTHEYHALLSDLEAQVENLRLGRLRDQIQGELRERIKLARQLLDQVERLVPHVVPEEKCQRRLDREAEQESRELAAKGEA
jgi:hypothetical protein